MTINKTAQKDQSDTPETTSAFIEQKLVAFAEQLGSLIGTVHAQAEGWLDRTALTKEIGRIRDGAAELLAQVNRGGTSPPKTAAKPTPTPTTRRSRGPVDAPGKRHRKPLPQEKLNKQMGEPRGKQMGQKAFKSGKRSGRG